MPRSSSLVSNASPLIYLAKIGELDLLKELYGAITIPVGVRDEATFGNSLDAAMIRTGIEDGWISVAEEDLKGEAAALAEVAELDPGEAEAVILAKRRNAMLLVDERGAAATARILGVQSVGTLGVLLLAVGKGRISHQRFRADVDNLVKAGFWLRADVYARVLMAEEELLKRAGRNN